MLRAAAALICLSAFLPACKTPDANSSGNDAGIVVTPPDNQRGTAFCWSYAITAHLEQRFYELTRGESSGGFRLNFSEEYLGLIRIAEQLINGEAIQEGLKLSDALSLVERYGIVPETIEGKNLFKAKFDFGIAADVNDQAQAWWQNRALPENSKIPPSDAVALIAAAAGLSAAQQRFLAAAIGQGPAADAEFRYANGTYSPQTWARNRLKFSRADYFVLQFPDSGRGQFISNPYTEEYLRAMKLVKKALLYGYSVPVSFNMLRGGLEKDGVLGCVEKGCWDTDLTVPSSNAPHANHAVLLVDYRSDKSSFGPASLARLKENYQQPPVEWVIKNSWGFNGNTSLNPVLLKRFPLPAFTVMLQDYFEMSHKLDPGRYEALLPRNVCMRAADRSWKCEDLITTTVAAGVPAVSAVNLNLDTTLIAANQNKSGMSRYPVVYKQGLSQVSSSQYLPLFQLTTPGPAPDQTLDQVNLMRVTKKSGINGDLFYLCAKVSASEKIKYVAMYMTTDDQSRPPAAPTFVLADQNGWQHCAKVSSDEGKFKVLLQGLDEKFIPKGEISTLVDISP